MENVLVPNEVGIGKNRPAGKNRTRLSYVLSRSRKGNEANICMPQVALQYYNTLAGTARHGTFVALPSESTDRSISAAGSRHTHYMRALKIGKSSLNLAAYILISGIFARERTYRTCTCFSFHFASQDKARQGMHFASQPCRHSTTVMPPPVDRLSWHVRVLAVCAHHQCKVKVCIYRTVHFKIDVYVV